VSAAGLTEVDDATLARALVGGEGWAAPLAWRRFATMVRGFFQRALGPAGESDDLTQDVFFSVFAKIRYLREPSALRSFIYSAAVRRLRWHLRTKRIRSVLTLSRSGEVPEGTCAGADSEGRELLARFYRLLDALGTNDRTAYVLRFVEGMSLGEIAKATGASLATVKRRITRACAQMAVLVQADPDLSPYLVASGVTDGS
jgi:RNA polymerase sigma-70 factor (ECF subfamily)